MTEKESMQQIFDLIMYKDNYENAFKVFFKMMNETDFLEKSERLPNRLKDEYKLIEEYVKKTIQDINDQNLMKVVKEFKSPIDPYYVQEYNFWHFTLMADKYVAMILFFSGVGKGVVQLADRSTSQVVTTRFTIIVLNDKVKN